MSTSDLFDSHMPARGGIIYCACVTQQSVVFLDAQASTPGRVKVHLVHPVVPLRRQCHQR